MRKAERLFQIINLLRNRRTVLTANQIAEKLEVSERTIYRDIQALLLSGVPIEGEAGVGYRIHRQFDLPPLMFDADEVEALLLGARMVKSWGDKQLSSSASSALQKILSILPTHLKDIEDNSPIHVPTFQSQQFASQFSEEIRQAIKTNTIIDINYMDINEATTQRTLWPLGLFFWGSNWTLVAWCELRNDYRTFRLSRINSLLKTEKVFTLSKNLNLEIFLEKERDRYKNCKKH